MRCKITGLSRGNKWRFWIWMRAARLRFDAPVVIAFKKTLRPRCYSSLWYGGEMAVICYKTGGSSYQPAETSALS